MPYQILRLNPGISLGGKSLHALGHPADHYSNFLILSSLLLTTQYEMTKYTISFLKINLIISANQKSATSTHFVPLN